MEALDARYRDERVVSIFIYTREAHPGEKRAHHTSMQDKLEAARAMAERLGISRRMLVDDLEGSVHRAFGTLPNMTYLVERGGTVNYKASWTDARTIEFALETMALARAGAREGKRVLPYHLQWRPTRVNDGRAFFNGLLEHGGERAALEYIEAAAQRFGEGHVKEHRKYWAAYEAAKS